jgi:hypothetical protein
MHGDAGVLREPGLDPGVFVGGVVVDHKVQLHSRVGLRDLLEEPQELIGAVPRETGLGDLPGGHLEGGDQGGGAVPDVVVGPLLRQVRSHRQDRRGPVQCLDLAFSSMDSATAFSGGSR